MAEDEVRTFLESDDELKQPSDAYIADIFGYRGGTRETEDPKVLEAHSRVERTVNWLRAHGTPTEISLETLTDQWHDELDAAIPMPMLSPDAQTIYERHRLNRIGSDTWTLEGDKAFWGEIEHLVAEKHPLWDEFALALDVEGKRAAQIQRWAWEREHLLPWGWILFNATKPPPDWLLGSLGVGNGTADAPVVTLRPTRLLRVFGKYTVGELPASVRQPDDPDARRSHAGGFDTRRGGAIHGASPAPRRAGTRDMAHGRGVSLGREVSVWKRAAP